ncbi:MAG: NAD-dependent epimerase/dehydratase family protein [bacterium]|nr:NAD-dependent epimerase/dehydratase family protein [bacterium]
MRILVTGAAGFIGYHLSKSLLWDGHKVTGLDIVNDYYDPRLKEDRLARLAEYPAFQLERRDVADRAALERVFQTHQPERVVHLAAQAGVRHSISHPHVYGASNLTGFLNILEACRHTPGVEGLVYASSSSVYGGNTKIPFSVEDRVDQPISLYAATKKANELMAHCYSHLYGLHVTGLRFFTVYGPWGRPDMALFLFTKAILAGEPIRVFNKGEMARDFTYIDDIVAGIRAAIERNHRCEIFNLGNHKSERLTDFIALIERHLGRTAERILEPMQPGDVPASFADIDHSREGLGYEPTTDIDVGIKRFLDWYLDYYKETC